MNDYIRSCDECQHYKSPRHGLYGLLQPLQIPFAAWTSISMDFINYIPESPGHTQIMVVVDWYTKMTHFIRLYKNVTVKRCCGYILTRSMEILWATTRNYIRYGRQVFRRILGNVMRVTRHYKENVNSLSPPDGQSDRENQLDVGRLLTKLWQLQSKRQVPTVATSWARLQHLSHKCSRDVAILRELGFPPADWMNEGTWSS